VRAVLSLGAKLISVWLSEGWLLTGTVEEAWLLESLSPLTLAALGCKVVGWSRCGGADREIAEE
jgi:hypothetical protein